MNAHKRRILELRYCQVMRAICMDNGLWSSSNQRTGSGRTEVDGEAHACSTFPRCRSGSSRLFLGSNQALTPHPLRGKWAVWGLPWFFGRGLEAGSDLASDGEGLPCSPNRRLSTSIRNNLTSLRIYVQSSSTIIIHDKIVMAYLLARRPS